MGAGDDDPTPPPVAGIPQVDPVTPEVGVPFDELSGAEAMVEGVEHVTVRGILLGSGPRFARDAFGPVLAFYIGWKLFGLVAGIGCATAVSLLAWRYERRRDRAGVVARLSLGFVIVQATIGLIAQSATVYLAQPVLLSAAFGIAFLVSAAIGASARRGVRE